MNTRARVLSLLTIAFIVYSVWVYTEGTDSSVCIDPPGISAQEGKLVYQKYNCSACHQIFGLGGYLGPELSNSLVQNSPSEVLAFSYLKYGSPRMPNLHLSDEEIQQVMDYLKYVAKFSGESNYTGSPVALK